jgi:hypothetical protein
MIRRKSELNSKELRDNLFYEGNFEKYIQPMYNLFESNKHIFTHHNIEGHNRP